MRPSNPDAKHGGSGSGNRSILSFFRPVSSPTRPETPPRSSSMVSPDNSFVREVTPSSPLSSPPQFLPPSPTPIKSSRPPDPTAPLSQSREIAASDNDGDDDSSSQSSLEDLSTLLGYPKPTPNASSHDNASTGLPATPRRTKRAAVEFPVSPLAIMTKQQKYKHKPKFDLKALVNDARRDDATMASCMKAKAAAEQAQKNAAAARGCLSGDAFADIVREKGGNDAHKVLRAVKRSEHQDQLHYCFFQVDYRTPSSLPPPQEVGAEVWSLITHGSIREREKHMNSGTPQIILQKTGKLPDSLFKWMLDDLCVQKSFPLRNGYCNMIQECPDQICRILTPEYLHHLFVRLGAHEDVETPSSELELCKMSKEPYEGHDWSCLRSFIQLLGFIACRLSVSATMYVAQTLLRMALDKFLTNTIDVLAAFKASIQSIVDAIPKSSWDAFCYETCSQMAVAVKVQTLRVDALLCLPASNVKIHDLRRRLATVFLFKDTTLANRIPEKTVTMQSIMGLLEGHDFAVSSKTDFTELKSSAALLDMVIDDGLPDEYLSDDAQFNQMVDDIAVVLGNIWRSINDSGMKLSRTEAKSVIELVQKRLMNSVRTRRKPKRSVFDAAQEEDPFVLQRQREGMKKFLQKQKKTPVNDCISVKSE